MAQEVNWPSDLFGVVEPIGERKAKIQVSLDHLSCEGVVALFYDGVIDSSTADGLIKASADSEEIKAMSQEMISAYYGP